MRKIFLTSLLPLIFGFFLITPVEAQEVVGDFYLQLRDVAVSVSIAENLVNQASGMVKLDTGEVVLIFDSEDLTYSHRVLVSDVGKVIQKDLVVPKAEQDAVVERYRNMTEGRVVEVREKVDSEELRGLPEEGIAFVVNPKDDSVMRVISFAPQTTSEFDTTIASDYFPRVREAPEISEEVSSNSLENVSELLGLGVFGSTPNMKWILIGAIILLVFFLGLLGVLLYRARNGSVS